MIPTLRDAAQQALDDLEDAAEEWSRYVVEDTAHCTLLKHLEPHINALRAALAEQQGPVKATPYNLKRIAWELERTAVGDGFYGNALRVAKDMPGITPKDRSVLDRYATGTQTGADHVHLQWLAQWLYNKDERAPEAPQLKAEQPAEQQPQEPVAWGIFYFGGKRNGRLYSQIDTEENAKRYISDLHRSNDTDTFRAAPLYTASQPRRNVTYVCPVCAASLERQE